MIFIKIGHNNSGLNEYASWYLESLIVHDLQTREKFYFSCEKWLAIDEQDGRIERTLPVQCKKQKYATKYLVSKHVKERLKDEHLWYSIYAKSPLSSFTRLGRTTCCFFMLYLQMMFNIMYYESDNNGVTFLFEPKQIVMGILTSALMFPFVFLLIQIFRRIRPRISRTEKLKCKINQIKERNKKELFFASNRQISTNGISKISSKSKRITLPWKIKFFVYAFSWVIMIMCILLILIKGISMGNNAVVKWAILIAFSSIASILLMYPCQVLFIFIYLYFL